MKRIVLALATLFLICLLPMNSSQAAPPVYAGLYTNDGGLTYRYRVWYGDTMTKVAKEFAPRFITYPVNDLAELNHLSPESWIYTGQELQIPTNWIRPHVTYVPAPTPTKETMTMPFDSSLFLTLLFFAFIVFVIGMIMYFLGRRPQNHHHCNCGNAYHPYCLPMPAPVLTIPPITINPIHMSVDHTFPAGGFPVSVIMTTPPAPVAKTP